MMKKYVALFLFIPIFTQAQVFYTESFETASGWSLDFSFDDGADSYVEAYMTNALVNLGYTLTGASGDYVIAAENTDGLVGEAPADGVITLTLDPVAITGMNDLELVVKLSCFATGISYDDRSLDNGDYLDFQISIDGSPWVTIGQFNSMAGGTSISTLFQDVDMDGNGGELGELPLTEMMRNFVMPIPGTGNSVSLRAIFHMDGGDEVIVMDDFRLRQSQGDDVPPSVFSAQVVDQNTLEVVFQEQMNSGAEALFHYAGVTGLSTATLQADQQTILLDYSTAFNLGQAYQLVVFSVQDLAGNAMTSAYNFPFHYNPTSPDLVITEIMYNDPSVEDTLEFIEIYNMDVNPAIVGGFRLEGAVTHTLASVTIPPGGFYLVARQSLSAESFYAMAFEDYGGQLSDNSEDIFLVNVDGVILDEVTYNDNVPWPSVADGFGPSMELISPDLDNSIGSNWVASTNGLGFINGLPLSATPGQLPGTILPSIEFDNNAISVNEIDGVIQLDIYIAASNNNPSTIHIEQISGTATSPDDHGITTLAELTLPANSSGIETVAFPLVNDNLVEGVEYFTIRMNAVSNCTIGLNDEITIIIADDDYDSPIVFINELQSSNTMTIQDPAGDFDDWFEVFNPNSFSVDLAGYYLSDDAADPMKARLPVADLNTVVPAQGFLLLWADQEEMQGALHVNFKLSALGESVLLTSPDGLAVVDQVDFSVIDQDKSYGRNCDGAVSWIMFNTPTPGAMNCPNSLLEQFNELTGFYPNPTSDVLYFPSLIPFEIFDLEGRSLMKGNGISADLSLLEGGMYILTSGQGVKKIIKE